MIESGVAEPPRAQLHHKIRNVFAEALRDYYRLNPKKLDDPATSDNLKALLKLLEGILNEIDKFEIAKKADDGKC